VRYVQLPPSGIDTALLEDATRRGKLFAPNDWTLLSPCPRGNKSVKTLESVSQYIKIIDIYGINTIRQACDVFRKPPS